MTRRWTAEDDRQLLALYRAGRSRQAIAGELGRTPDAIDARRRLLGRPSRTRPARRWTVAEDAFLRAASQAHVPAPEIGRRLHRTPYAVRRRREALGIVTRPSGRPYLAHEDEALRAALATDRSLRELAARLGRSEGALRLRAKALGLVELKERARWTSEEDAQLRAAYTAGLSASRIHRELLPRRTPTAVVARAQLLGLATFARRWTADEEQRLARLVTSGAGLDGVARTLHRSREAIVSRCRSLELTPPPAAGRGRRGHARWTAAEDEILVSRRDADTLALARILGRTEGAVRRRQRQLEIRRPGRTQHHAVIGPLLAVSPGLQRQIERELPLTPSRSLAVATRLKLPLSQLRRLAQIAEQHATAQPQTAKASTQEVAQETMAEQKAS